MSRVDIAQKHQRMIDELNAALLTLFEAQENVARIGENVLWEIKFSEMSTDDIDRWLVALALMFVDGWDNPIDGLHVVGAFEVLRDLARYVNSDA